MAGAKRSIDIFRNAHFSKELKLPVQVHFIRELDTKPVKHDLAKKSRLFHTPVYLTETFYKPIHHGFDITKIK